MFSSRHKSLFSGEIRSKSVKISRNKRKNREKKMRNLMQNEKNPCGNKKSDYYLMEAK